MKKILFNLVSISAIAVPVISIVSCRTMDENGEYTQWTDLDSSKTSAELRKIVDSGIFKSYGIALQNQFGFSGKLPTIKNEEKGVLRVVQSIEYSEIKSVITINLLEKKTDRVKSIHTQIIVNVTPSALKPGHKEIYKTYDFTRKTNQEIADQISGYLTAIQIFSSSSSHPFDKVLFKDGLIEKTFLAKECLDKSIKFNLNSKIFAFFDNVLKNHGITSGYVEFMKNYGHDEME